MVGETNEQQTRQMAGASVCSLSSSRPWVPNLMNPISMLMLGLAMSTDAFAAALAKGAAMSKPQWAQALRVGLIFGVVEAITPVIGWLLGSVASKYIESYDHWIAFGLLGVLGLHMIWKALTEKEDEASEDKTPATVRY